MAPTYHQGRFIPKNPSKYKGDITQIYYRSSWEFQFLKYLDEHKDIVWYSSEELVIPYVSPIDGKWHRYFVDMVAKNVSGDILAIEIKPFNQTQEPVMKESKSRKTFIKEVMTYGINKAKWEAADNFCKKKGWKFLVLTEKDLRTING